MRNEIYNELWIYFLFPIPIVQQEMNMKVTQLLLGNFSFCRDVLTFGSLHVSS